MVDPLPSFFFSNLVPALCLIQISIIIFLKLISYSHVNRNIMRYICKIKELKKNKKDFKDYIEEAEIDGTVIFPLTSRT